MYIYKFLDKDRKVIYVGQTHNIGERILNHIKNGHLPIECYEQIDKIEYLTVGSRSEANIVEVYFINLYKPIYNSLDKCNEPLKVKLKGFGKWRPFKDVPLSLAIELGCKCKRLEMNSKQVKSSTYKSTLAQDNTIIDTTIDETWVKKANSHIAYINSVINKSIGEAKPVKGALRLSDIIADSARYCGMAFISTNTNTNILLEFISPIKLKITDRTHYITGEESDTYYYTIGSLDDIGNPGSFTLRGILPYLLFTRK